MDTEKNIAEIMIKDVVTVHVEDAISKVQDLFDENTFHHIVVTDNKGFCGIISNNDMLNMFLDAYNSKSEISLTDKKAKDIMTSNPLSIDIEDSIGFAADIFLANHIHALPVLDGDELAGIVTDYDLLKYAYK